MSRNQFTESWQDQEQAIFDILNAQIGVGGLIVPQAGNQPIQGVDRVSPPEGQTYPRIGIQYQSTLEASIGAAMGQRTQTNTFELTIVVQAPFDAENSDIAREAFEAVENFVNDKTGGGVLPLLRSNPTLNDTANWVIPQNQEIVLGSQEDSSTISALFRCTIIAEGRVYV